jgi:hypothetical protein
MRHEARDIAEMLTMRMDALVRALFPQGRRDGAEWRIGSLLGEPGKSLAIRITGSKKGIWKDFASGQTGDALDLVAEAMCHGDISEAIKWAKGWLGIDRYDDAQLQRVREDARRDAEKRAQSEQKYTDANRFIAQRMWLHGGHNILATPIAAYLAGRSIDLNLLPRLPRALRYSSECYSSETGQRYPAMLACVNGPDGKQTAVHRTYLQIHPDGRVTKAALEKAKAVLGSYAGGYIPINRGASNKRISDAPADDRLVITEGIEDALTLALAVPECRIIAAVSLSNMANLVLPEQLKLITIAADNDQDNPQAMRGLQRAIDAFKAQGRTVRVARSAKGKDFNDWRMAG